MITNAVSNGNIDFSLDSAQGDYMVDFFESPSCDPSGHGEGDDFFLSRLTHHTSPAGNQVFSTPVGPLDSGELRHCDRHERRRGNHERRHVGVLDLLPDRRRARRPTPSTARTTSAGSPARPPRTTATCAARSSFRTRTPARRHDRLRPPTPGVQPIIPNTDLPAITDPVTIDGTTQTGFAGTPLVVLDGSYPSGATTGLHARRRRRRLDDPRARRRRLHGQRHPARPATGTRSPATTSASTQTARRRSRTATASPHSRRATRTRSAAPPRSTAT